MNRECRSFYGCVVSFDEKKLRKIFASQLNNRAYIEGKKKVIEIIFNRRLDYNFRKKALFNVFRHMQNQGVVIYGNGGITVSEMLKIMREVLN